MFNCLMDWQVQQLSKESSLTGQPFELGCRVLSFLYLDDLGQLSRTDILEKEEETFTPPGRVLGKWSRIVEPVASEREAQKQALQSSEELFFSLIESNVDTEEIRVIKHLLALKLERKRILKRLIPVAVNRKISYQHSKTKTLVEVEDVEITPDEMPRIQEKLDYLVV